MDVDKKTARKAQKSEITGHLIYLRLAERDTGANRKLLLAIAKDERKHYEYWKKVTKRDVAPGPVWWYVFLARLFGVVFLLKYLERNDQAIYGALQHEGLAAIIADEERHEMLLLSKYKEERLDYASSVVLGLNDALVELTGVLAGLTLALANSTLVAIAGFVTGVAASLSMAASAYFAAKEENNPRKKPFKVAAYTGGAYIVIVLILVAPFVLLANIFVSLGMSLILGIGIVAFYTFYISIAKGLPFWRRFIEMAFVSIAVAIISFVLGYLLNTYVGVNA